MLKVMKGWEGPLLDVNRLDNLVHGNEPNGQAKQKVFPQKHLWVYRGIQSDIWTLE